MAPTKHVLSENATDACFVTRRASGKAGGLVVEHHADVVIDAVLLTVPRWY